MPDDIGRNFRICHSEDRESATDWKKITFFKEDIALLQVGMNLQVQQGNIQLKSHIPGTNSPIDNTTFPQIIRNFGNYTYLDTLNNTFYFANGSSIHLNAGNALDFVIDWNGDASPNLNGDDQLYYHFNDNTITWAGIPCGHMGPSDSDTSSLALEQAIFQ